MKPSKATERHQGIGSKATMAEVGEAAACPQHYWCLALLLLVLNLISSAAFIYCQNRPVFDESYNMADVHAYATNGISVSTVQAQKNAPGPTSFLWIAAGVRLLGASELRGARIAVLTSWVVLGVALLVGGRLAGCPELWCGALLFTLVLPHSMMATGTVLTEAPGLMFAAGGTLAWTEFMSKTGINLRALALGVIGGLSLGMATTCRQYYVALLGSAVVVLLLHLARARDRKWLGSVTLSLVMAAIPLCVLLKIWGGISSPSMAAGRSYSNYQAAVGWSMGRPVIAGFAVLLYLMPLTLPSVIQETGPLRRWAVLVAVLAGIVAVPFRSFLVQPGPLHSLIRIGSPLRGGATVFFGLIACLTAYNAIGAGLSLWGQRARVACSVPLQFSLLTILFFVVEQCGVGGNIRFYDRYILQIAPFLGVVSYCLFPKLTGTRIAAVIGLSVLSQAMLWRFAI